MIPKEYIPSVEYGVRECAKSGVLGGYPMVNVFVDLVFGSYHDVDSSQVAFEQAGRLAFKLACEEAGIGLLEPIMKVTITTPEDFFGTVSGDISSRRGQIVDSELRGIVRIITAEVPFSEMFGYTSTLRGLTQGRASSSMEPLEYRMLPPRLAEDVLQGLRSMPNEDPNAAPRSCGAAFSFRIHGHGPSGQVGRSQLGLRSPQSPRRLRRAVGVGAEHRRGPPHPAR